jgi:hypothetical protein
LIRRFIDGKARFTFAPEDRVPAGAVPFDMFHEEGFGHRGDDCTFETLEKQFRVRDARVAVIGQIIHDADLLDERFGRKQGYGVDKYSKAGRARKSRRKRTESRWREWSCTTRLAIASPEEGSATARKFLGVGHSRSIVFKLSSLFALDSFGGGFVVQSFAAYWFYLRFGVQPVRLGVIFFWANVLAGISALLASRLASRIGLVKTMVVTHLPSNVLLILVPLMPNLTLAVMVLLIRFSISQMDVPTRQSYTMAVVRPEERSAAGGITGVARTVGAAMSPIFAGLLFSRPLLVDVPFFIAGALKIAYDLILYREFAAIRPPEEGD